MYCIFNGGKKKKAEIIALELPSSSPGLGISLCCLAFAIALLWASHHVTQHHKASFCSSTSKWRGKHTLYHTHTHTKREKRERERERDPSYTIILVQVSAHLSQNWNLRAELVVLEDHSRWFLAISLYSVRFVQALTEWEREAGFLLEAYWIKKLLWKFWKMNTSNTQMWLRYKQIIALKRITKPSWLFQVQEVMILVEEKEFRASSFSVTVHAIAFVESLQLQATVQRQYLLSDCAWLFLVLERI